MQFVDKAFALGEVAAQRSGDRRHQHVVDGRASGVPDGLHVIERDRVGPGDLLGNSQLALQDRARVGAREERLADGLGVVARCRGEVDQLGRVPDHLNHLVGEASPDVAAGRGDASGGANQVADQTAYPAALGLPGFLGVDARVGLGIGQRKQDPGQRDPIGDAVVHAGDDRGAGAVAVHEVPVPQRTGPVKRLGRQISDQFLQGGPVAGRRQGGVVQMQVEVEVRVVLPDSDRVAGPGSR